MMGDALRPMASGYSDAGASTVRRALKGFTAISSNANEDINWNNYTMRQRARMLYMSSPVAASAIKTNRTKVVGTGLTLKASIEHKALGMTPEAAKEWQQNTEREFSLWASKKENCDAIGMNDFAGMQQLAMLSWLTNGDCFALFQWYKETAFNPYGLRVHMIEADRISTPITHSKSVIGGRITDGKNPDNNNMIYDGVEVNSTGMVVAYHICSVYPNQLKRDKDIKWQRVNAYGKRTGLPNILHVMDSERCDQYRGVTYLAPVIESLLNISRYTQSELMAALIQSFFTAWIKTNTNTAEIPINEVNDDDPDVPVPDTNPSPVNENEYDMGPGMVLHLKPDEDVAFGSPNIPSQGFDAFFKVICKEIGAALEIPYDTLLKEFNASYSASRAALMEAWEGFKMRRTWLVNMFCQPIYERWLTEAVAIGRIKAPGFFSDPRIRAAWCKARWIGPVQGQLDPTKEVKANIMAVAHGYKTHEQVAIEYGGDWHENMERLKDENATLAELSAIGGDDADQYVQEPDDPEKGDGDNAEQK